MGIGFIFNLCLKIWQINNKIAAKGLFASQKFSFSVELLKYVPTVASFKRMY